jgi:S1-C subfamily serine protease
MVAAHHPNTSDVRAILEHLTGPSRREVTWLIQDYVLATVDQDGTFHLSTEPIEDQAAELVGFSWSDGSYVIEATGDQNIWLNGRKVHKAQLHHGDMIEFGEDGPMSRFRLCSAESPIHWTISDVLDDSIAYLRTSRKPVGLRLSRAVSQLLRRLALETTVLFRISVFLSLLGLAAVGYLQFQSNQQLQLRLEEEAMRIEGVIASLAQTRQESIKPGDLRALRQELNLQLTTHTERLADLEHRSEAAARVIANSFRSVVFIQGAYGLRQSETNKLLKHILGPDGKPRKTPFGQPMLSPDGNGNPVEFQFTGTGFLLQGGLQIVTNRHVALPWENGEVVKSFAARGYKPEMLKMLVYHPGEAKPSEAQLGRVSNQVDLAILELSTAASVNGLAISAEPPDAGDEVIVMGYPTGLRSLLAQAGAEFIKALEKEGKADFWFIATKLASEGKIQPLATRGIIGQVATAAIIYDAETTHGGSGGPVLNRQGRVVAINTAILPEFGGSNIGVPATKLSALLEID